jgi:hypothetical protein
MPRSVDVPDPASPPPTEEQAATYDRLVPMLYAAHHEMTELSKKKQDGVVNALKIKMINRLLTELSSVIEKDPSYAFVDLLEEDTLPQNSDVVLILSQWKAALSQYHGTHYRKDGYERRWFTA